MKIDINWIEAAQKALEVHIVNKEGEYPKSFKGYISALGASIVQSGVVPALSIYEADNEPGNSSGADNNRVLLVMALVDVFKSQKKNLLPTGWVLLADYLATLQGDKLRELSQAIDQGLVALKLALRFYKPAEHKLQGKLDLCNPAAGTSGTCLPNGNYSDNPNLGWIYYRDLYRNFKRKDLEQVDENTRQSDLTRMLDAIFNASFGHYAKMNRQLMNSLKQSGNGISSFSLTTTYPGMLAGTGLNHGVKSKQDIKSGFQFDYTTGLPYLPGSSVKGALRSLFPKNESDGERMAYIAYLLKKIVGIEGDIAGKDIIKLKDQLFSENETTSKRCVFFDAIITDSCFVPESSNRAGSKQPDRGRFIGNDYITPHSKPLRDPIPIQFIKILPQVTFTFAFRFPTAQRMISGRILNDNHLKELFIRILKDGGIGAKTNVGYGHLK